MERKEPERITFEMSGAAIGSIKYALALSEEHERRARMESEEAEADAEKH